MGGHDPYSSSKGAAELVAAAYLRSSTTSRSPPRAPATSSAAATWPRTACSPTSPAHAMGGAPAPIRNPQAVRPWQHVLNPLQRLPGARPAPGGRRGRPRRLELRPRPRTTCRPVGWLVERLDGRCGRRAAVGDRPGPASARGRAPRARLDEGAHASSAGAPAGTSTQALEAIVEWYAASSRRRPRRAGGHARPDRALLYPLGRDDCDLPLLRRPARDGVRRPRHVAARELLPAAGAAPTRWSRSIRCSALGLRRVLPRAARGVRDARARSSATTRTSRRTRSSWLEHSARYVELMIERFGLDGSSQVVELASNDGYLLQYFVRARHPGARHRAGRQRRRGRRGEGRSRRSSSSSASTRRRALASDRRPTCCSATTCSPTSPTSTTSSAG